MPEKRMPLIIADNFITVPIGDAAQKVFETWLRENLDSLRPALAPFRVDPNDIRMPWLERIVYVDEAERPVVEAFRAEGDHEVGRSDA